MPPTKSNKRDRQNAWILGEAQKRASERIRAYLNSNQTVPSGLTDEQFDDAMPRIMKAMAQMYSDAVGDTLDTLEGRELQPLK